MNKEKGIKLYNIFIPIWLIVALPPFLLVTLPVNYILDWIVVRISLKKQSILEYKKLARKLTWKVWIAGFLSDFVGIVLMFLVEFIPSGKLAKILTNTVSYNCFSNPLSFIYVVICICASSILIYILNLKICFKNINELSLHEKKRLAKHLALWTAPYLFLLPTRIV